MIPEFSERWLLQITLASIAAVVAATLMRPGQAGTARVFGIICALGLCGWALMVNSPLRFPFVTTEPGDAFWFWQGYGSLPAWVAGLWVLIGIGLIGWRLARVRSELKQLRCAELAPQTIQTAAAQIVERAGLQLTPDVRLTDDLSSPAASTLAGNLVALPRASTRWQPHTLEAVLGHELVHIRRRDDRWLLFMRLVCDVYWPLVWLRALPVLFEQHMEASCDDEASELCGDPLRYCNALGVVSRQSLANRPHASVLFGGGAIAHRVRRFLGARSRDLNSGKIYWLAILVFAVVPMAFAFEPVLQQAKPVATTTAVRLASPDNAPRVLVRHFQLLPGERLADARRRLTRLADDRPIYPGSALLNDVEGDVWVEFGIAADGRVVAPAVIDADPPHVFERASLSAIERVNFEPTDGPSLGSPDRMRVLHQYRLPDKTNYVP